MFTTVSLKQISRDLTKTVDIYQKPSWYTSSRQWKFPLIICFIRIKVVIFKWSRIMLFWGNFETPKICLWKDFNFSLGCLFPKGYQIYENHITFNETFSNLTSSISLAWHYSAQACYYYYYYYFCYFYYYYYCY